MYSWDSSRRPFSEVYRVDSCFLANTAWQKFLSHCCLAGIVYAGFILQEKKKHSYMHSYMQMSNRGFRWNWSFSKGFSRGQDNLKM